MVGQWLPPRALYPAARPGMLLLPGRAAEDCLAHVTALLYPAAGLTSCWSARPLCPQPFPVSLPAQSTPHLLSSPPRPLPTLLSPSCTSANGGVKVNVGFHLSMELRINEKLAGLRFKFEVLQGVVHGWTDPVTQ